ncbi:ATP-binding protein, partial [Flavobacteriaceae bacterium]|nr:ATP-binding protein [Flavobacteriaceae bacterium]
MKKTYQLEEIFTPSQPAKHTFVERSSVKKRLDRAFRTPGKQIIIYGYSGAGKTTLLRNKLESENINYITTPCIKGMSISDIVIDAFNQLEIYYTQGKEKVESNKVGGTLSASYLGLKASLGAETKGDSKISKRRAVELPITPQTLAKFIGESENCWVIEDFHKIESSNKIQMAQIMKVFMDASVNYPKLKIIAIGAVNSAREVVQFDPEMKNRITELQVPLMNEESLNEILNTGEKLLNIKIPTKIVDRIVSYSSGLPAVTHQLGLLLCEVNKIFQTHDSSKVFEITQSSFEIALDEYLEENSDSLKAVYEFA